jgi:hypothetical protein
LPRFLFLNRQSAPWGSDCLDDLGRPRLDLVPADLLDFSCQKDSKFPGGWYLWTIYNERITTCKARK